MKYFNHRKAVRNATWTKVTRPLLSNGWTPAQELKKWCQDQASDGKFYFYVGSDSWWFEHAEDAMMFKLRWA